MSWNGILNKTVKSFVTRNFVRESQLFWLCSQWFKNTQCALLGCCIQLLDDFSSSQIMTDYVYGMLRVWCCSITVVTDSDAIRNPLGLHYLSQDSLLVRALASWSEGCKFKFWQERQENFLLQCQLCVLTLIQCPFHPRVTAVVHKRPWSFSQKCRWQVNLNTHTLLTQQTRIGLTMLLSRHSVGTYQETSSHATRQVTLGHCRLSSLSCCGLILAWRVELVCVN